MAQFHQSKSLTIGSILICFLLLITSASSANLKKLLVVFRHGQRTPTVPLPFPDFQTWDNNFPMQVSSSNTRQEQLYFVKPTRDEGVLLGNSFSGQLTDAGVKQQVSLGRTLAQRYGRQLGFNSEQLPANAIHTETTWKPRTIRSLLSHLSGWFSEGMPVDPPSISTTELTDLYANWYEHPIQCPPVVDIQKAITREQDFVDYMQQQEDFRKHLSQKLDVPLEDIDIFFLHDSLSCYVAEGYNLPRNLTMDEYERIETIATWEYNYYFSNKQFVRLSIGHFLGRIQKFITQNDTETNKRLFLFSSHDMGIMPLLASLSYLPKEWPYFASNIVFEVYDNNTVRIFYNQDTQIPIPGCGLNYCPLDVFFSSTEWAIPNDWRQECNVKHTNDMFAVPLTSADLKRARAT